MMYLCIKLQKVEKAAYDTRSAKSIFKNYVNKTANYGEVKANKLHER